MCTTPRERVRNPGYWEIHEPELRQAMKEHGKGIECNWEDPEWTMPPLPTVSAGESSDSTDEDMPTMEWDDADFLGVQSSTLFRCLSLTGCISAYR